MKDENGLGNEEGYRRLEDDEVVAAGDETYGAMSNSWEKANDAQINKKACEVGGWHIWRRRVS